MNIKQAKEQIKNAVQAYFSKDEFGCYIIPTERQRPVFMIGAPGIGKTAIMEQIAQELNIGLVSYSMTHHTRQSALGLPYIAKKEFDGKQFSVSEYTMSEIIASVYTMIEETGHREGILFLDEINCVSETLAPAMLQFLQYKIFGMHQVPPGWIVVTAGNPPEYNKSVREFDVVTCDRLKRIDVEPDYAVWKEYASQKGIHGAILSFLDIKKDFFYVMETRVDRKSFVTARGWEDLSEMIRLYEKNALTVDLNLVEQYLQNRTVAREFALYYDLYQKYSSDYQVDQILAGKASEEIRQRAAAAAFDERLSLMSLLTDAISEKMQSLVIRDAAVLENRKLLRKLREEITPANWEQLLEQQMQGLEESLLAGEKAHTLDGEKIYALQYMQRFLRAQQGLLRLAGAEEPFAVLRRSYEQALGQHKEDLKKVREELDNVFAFVEAVFGSEQEMLILVTELTVRYYCARFISQFGCEAYFTHNRELMFYERRKDLIARMDELEENEI